MVQWLNKKTIAIAFIGAVAFGVLASQAGVIGQIGSLPQKVTSKIASV